MVGLTWLRGLLVRRSGRIAATAGGIAIAVAILASLGSFLAASKATMTRRAIADVAVDWQVEAQRGADPSGVLARVQSQPKVKAALPVQFADTTGFEASLGASTQTTGPGVALGLPARYRSRFPGEMRTLAGASDGVLVAQQTAANLRITPGDTVRIGRAGLPAVTVTIDGVVDLPQANSLFQTVGAASGAQPAAPPDNVILLPDVRWHELFDLVGGERPDLVRHQVHVRLARHLPSDPAGAFAEVSGEARNLESRLAGAGLVGDNLSARLDAARSDALYAQVLFLFLGLPAAVLAGLLAMAVTGAGADRRRREQALLRARGATTARLVHLALVEAVLVGLVGAAAGLGIAALVGRIGFHAVGFGGRSASIMWSLAAVGAGLLIAAAVVIVPAWRTARMLTVASGRRRIGFAARPRWVRFDLAVVVLAAAGLVFWATSRSGYKLVLAPEGAPSISVSYWAFVGPALLWLGAGLLGWRIADVVLVRGRSALRSIFRPVAGRLAGTVTAAMVRQRRLLARSLVLVALTVTFAVSTAVFNSTYRRQALEDARLSNGADVTVTEPPGVHVSPRAASALSQLSGVRHVEPIQHRFAYVGADLQDLYGVRPRTIVSGGRLDDTWFAGGSASELAHTLARQRDGVLVSVETAKDFQLRVGDPIRLRLQSGPTKKFTTVRFHYVGIVKEFPSAPSDSFLVANSLYIAQRTGSDTIGTFLVDTGGRSPKAVARAIRARVGTRAKVTDITSATKLVGSSLTSVDLAGLTRIELGFALVLASAATGLVFVLGFAERRRNVAIASALGARPRQLAGFIWSEATFVTVGGLLLGAAGGWVLAVMLVKALSGVFDPPPSTMAVPFGYLAGVAVAAVGAVAFAGLTTIRATRTPSVEILRDL